MGETASDLCCCDGAVAGVLAEGWEGEEDGGGLEIRAEMEEVVDGENDRAGGEMVRCVGAETTWTGGVADGVDEEGSAGPSASLIVASTAAITAEDGDVAEPAAFVVEAASEGEAAAAPRVASRRDSRMRAMAGGGEGDASRAAATFGGGGDATGSGGDEETRDRGVVVVDGVLFPEMPGLAGPAFFWAWNFLSCRRKYGHRSTSQEREPNSTSEEVGREPCLWPSPLLLRAPQRLLRSFPGSSAPVCYLDWIPRRSESRGGTDLGLA